MEKLSRIFKVNCIFWASIPNGHDVMHHQGQGAEQLLSTKEGQRMNQVFKAASRHLKSIFCISNLINKLMLYILQEHNQHLPGIVMLKNWRKMQSRMREKKGEESLLLRAMTKTKID